MNIDENNFNSLIGDIAEHYHHAVEKHPYFADKWTNEQHMFFADQAKYLKDTIRSRAQFGEVSARVVLNAEIAEVFEAITRGDTEQAREEIFDAIAVLIRMVDAIDGLQTFGNGENHKCQKADCRCNDSRGVCLRKGGKCRCADCNRWRNCEKAAVTMKVRENEVH